MKRGAIRFGGAELGRAGLVAFGAVSSGKACSGIVRLIKAGVARVARRVTALCGGVGLAWNGAVERVATRSVWACQGWLVTALLFGALSGLVRQERSSEVALGQVGSVRARYGKAG